jgi:hypothetical protein
MQCSNLAKRSMAVSSRQRSSKFLHLYVSSVIESHAYLLTIHFEKAMLLSVISMNQQYRAAVAFDYGEFYSLDCLGGPTFNDGATFRTGPAHSLDRDPKGMRVPKTCL